MTKNSELIAVQLDGKKAWSFPGTGQPGAPVLGASGTIYFPVGHNLYAVDPSGHEKWEVPLDSDGWGSMTLSSDGTLYAATRTGTFYAFPVGEGLMGAHGRNSKEMSETRARRESNKFPNPVADRSVGQRRIGRTLKELLQCSCAAEIGNTHPGSRVVMATQVNNPTV